MATVIALCSPDISAIVTASLSGTATGLLALAGTPAGAAVGTVDYGAVGGAVGVGQASAWQLAVGVGQASTPTHPATSGGIRWRWLHLRRRPRLGNLVTR